MKKPYRDLLVELGIAATATVLVVVVLGSCLDTCSSTPEPDRLDSLRAHCTSSGGILVEAVASDGDGKQGLFSICIPERAFYCVDVD